MVFDYFIKSNVECVLVVGKGDNSGPVLILGGNPVILHLLCSCKLPLEKIVLVSDCNYEVLHARRYSESYGMNLRRKAYCRGYTKMCRQALHEIFRMTEFRHSVVQLNYDVVVGCNKLDMDKNSVVLNSLLKYSINIL
ncbi:hypothetical protein DICVIV_13650 [Dictyocaulus viviparus]|uniref:Uncharacterized protein n=1 Tax=Dictyocaulus viviparus TaxID=29172 RepID=A0A0D8X9U2_DICVI|nr:hypothetical protein DICVIV_13650 [Dictyocaulus viviparus]